VCTATVSGRRTFLVDGSARGEDVYMATRGDILLAIRGDLEVATREDFLMATDSPLQFDCHHDKKESARRADADLTDGAPSGMTIPLDRISGDVPVNVPAEPVDAAEGVG